jgi:hypothetical protein
MPAQLIHLLTASTERAVFKMAAALPGAAPTSAAGAPRAAPPPASDKRQR